MLALVPRAAGDGGLQQGNVLDELAASSFTYEPLVAELYAALLGFHGDVFVLDNSVSDR